MPRHKGFSVAGLISIFFLGTIFLCIKFSYAIPFQQDTNQFQGERIKIEPPRSNRIGQLIVTLKLPEGYELFRNANSHLKVFSADGKYSRQDKIFELKSNFPVYQEIHGDKLYVELILNYCKHGKDGMCLLKNILFEIPLVTKMNGEFIEEDIQLDYVASSHLNSPGVK